MKKYLMLLFMLLLPVASFADAGHGGDISNAQALIEAKVSCQDLTEEEFIVIGEYYMEQMHPGEAHHIMDERMGGEGSDSLREAHVKMAKSFYCDDSSSMFSGMRGMRWGKTSGLTRHSAFTHGGMMNMEMMGSMGWFGMGLFWLIYIAVGAFVFGIVFWWTKKLVLGETKKKR